MTVYASVLKKPSQNYWDVFDLPGRLYATCSRLHFPVYLRINFMLSVCIHGSPMKGALHRFSLNSCRDENWTWWSLHKSFLCRCEAYQTDKAGKIEHILQSQTEKNGKTTYSEKHSSIRDFCKFISLPRVNVAFLLVLKTNHWMD